MCWIYADGLRLPKFTQCAGNGLSNLLGVPEL